ncbi:MAG: TetR/AcrR family transcriptional regulator [Bacteroidetes bacterium]|nr:MAG: TetR/AcrR family transcriptional regulator [Bacteroidota bacterium]
MDTKARILQQASTMFLRYGIRSITMDEIAQSLGISKRTLYESFSNKEDLLTHCIEYQHVENKRIRDIILAENEDDPLEIIHQHFRQALIILNSLHPNFFNDLRKYHPRIWKEQIESKQEENIEFTTSMIMQGASKGVFLENEHPEILSTMIHSVMQMITLGDIFPETRYPRSEVIRQVMLNFIRGLATEEGLRLIDEKFSQNPSGINQNQKSY